MGQITMGQITFISKQTLKFISSSFHGKLFSLFIFFDFQATIYIFSFKTL